METPIQSISKELTITHRRVAEVEPCSARALPVTGQTAELTGSKPIKTLVFTPFQGPNMAKNHSKWLLQVLPGFIISPIRIAMNFDMSLSRKKRKHNVVPAVTSWFEKLRYIHHNPILATD